MWNPETVLDKAVMQKENVFHGEVPIPFFPPPWYANLNTRDAEAPERAFQSCYVTGDLKTSLTGVLNQQVPPHAQNNFRPHECLYSCEMWEWSGRSNILHLLHLLHLHTHSISRWCRVVHVYSVWWTMHSRVVFGFFPPFLKFFLMFKGLYCFFHLSCPLACIPSFPNCDNKKITDMHKSYRFWIQTITSAGTQQNTKCLIVHHAWFKGVWTSGFFKTFNISFQTTDGKSQAFHPSWGH